MLTSLTWEYNFPKISQSVVYAYIIHIIVYIVHIEFILDNLEFFSFCKITFKNIPKASLHEYVKKINIAQDF